MAVGADPGPPDGGRIRRRLVYLGLAAATIAVGLVVHSGYLPLGPVVRDVTGDALWAMMMAWWVGAAAPRAALGARSIAALMICIAVELSQLLHTPALDALRRTTPGQLVLGSGFEPRDLAAYTLGVVAAALLERAVRRP